MYIYNIIYIYVYLFTPSDQKTVLVKSTFLGLPTNMAFGLLARVGWGGVGWGVITFCRLRSSACNWQHALNATLLPFFM